MSLFIKYEETTAPENSAMLLSAAKKRYGFVPNLAAYLAESPLVLDAVLKLSGQFDQSTLTPQEQQVVLMTVSAMNKCSYCTVAHTALGKSLDLGKDILQAVSELETVNDPRLESLRSFTQTIVENRGWVEERSVQAFLDAGFTKAQVFEVVLGVGLKTITNYCNHLAHAEPNEEFLDMAGDVVTA